MFLKWADLDNLWNVLQKQNYFFLIMYAKPISFCSRVSPGIDK